MKKEHIAKRMSSVEQGTRKLEKFFKPAPKKINPRDLPLDQRIKHHTDMAAKETNPDFKEQHEWMVKRLQGKI